MSFKESIIIPHSLFKRCQFSSLETEPGQILNNPTLPSDLKMKLFTQANALGRRSPVKEQEEDPAVPGDTSYLVTMHKESNQPFVASILGKIKGRPEEISWTDNLEVKIDNRLIPHSNIIELLKFVMKSSIITSDMDIPPGSKEFFNKLIEIGVPRSWMKVSFPKKPPRRKVVRASKTVFDEGDTDDDAPASKLQKGQGKGWLVY